MTSREVKHVCEIAANARRVSREHSLKIDWTRAARFAIGAFLILIFAGIRPAAAQAPSGQVKTVALLGVQLLNDNEDREPTTDAERTRLAAIKELFRSQVEASDRYKFVPIAADAAAKIAAGPEIGNCGGCEFKYGAQLHADLAAWIVVQKVSNLILNFNVYVADVAAHKLAFVHSVDIRGNTDESWTRGMTYLVKNYVLADPL